MADGLVQQSGLVKSRARRMDKVVPVSVMHGHCCATKVRIEEAEIRTPIWQHPVLAAAPTASHPL